MLTSTHTATRDTQCLHARTAHWQTKTHTHTHTLIEEPQPTMRVELSFQQRLQGYMSGLKLTLSRSTLVILCLVLMSKIFTPWWRDWQTNTVTLRTVTTAVISLSPNPEQTKEELNHKHRCSWVYVLCTLVTLFRQDDRREGCKGMALELVHASCESYHIVGPGNEIGPPLHVGDGSLALV